MENFLLLVSVILNCFNSYETYVLKTGKLAPITINDTLTKDGQMYMKKCNFQLIFPGTKWCGAGDIASNYTDLGKYSATDACCRQHDYCNDLLLSGEKKGNLTNTHKYTRLHCRCDKKFHTCLQTIKTEKIASQLVGTSYFDFLAPQCFAFVHPATCIKNETTFGINKRCVSYKFNYAAPPLWQWFDVPKW